MVRRSTSMLTESTEKPFVRWAVSCLQANVARSKEVVHQLRSESRSWFASLVEGSTNDTSEEGALTRPKFSNAEALSDLIQHLKPAFSSEESHLTTRLAALFCLTGAIEGCQREGLPDPTWNLLGTFLLTHCGPIQDADTEMEQNAGEDIDEQVRDAALVCLDALMRCPSDKSVVKSFITQRLTVAQTGVEYRCASPDIENHGDDGSFDRYRAPVESGLSLLPRSRRSKCFDLLRAFVDWFASIYAADSPSLEVAYDVAGDLASFASFVATCLHAESDPRCLLQMLLLIRALQEAFWPIFRESGSDLFPVGEMFDSIVPYYPIQFTPPPHDVHNITREDLREAILSVMSFTDYDELSRDSMLGLSLGVVLERLVPPVGDSPPTFIDQEEGLLDVDGLLFSDKKNADRISEAYARNTSDCFVSVHHSAAMAVIRGGADIKAAKQVAEKCRTLSAKVAYEAEFSSNDPLWQAFVVEAMSKLTPKLCSPDEEGRIALAYVAALCACGGSRTMQLGLEMGLSRLISIISREDIHSAEELEAATYGIAAFSASCRVCIEKAGHAGIVINPHPLEMYCSKAFKHLYPLTLPTTLHAQSMPRSTSLRTGAIRAMEALFLASASECIPEDAEKLLIKFVNDFRSGYSTELKEDSSGELASAFSQTVGSLLGRSISSSLQSLEAEGSGLKERESELTKYLNDVLLSDLLSSSIEGPPSGSSVRLDRVTLALSASNSFDAASKIVSSLMGKLVERLRRKELDRAQEVANVLSGVFSVGKGVVGRAYQHLDTSPYSLAALVEAVSTLTEVDESTMPFGLNLLRLSFPKTEQVGVATAHVRQLVGVLRTAYEWNVSESHLELLVKLTNDALPPLSNQDIVKLSALLPLLSAALKQVELQNLSDSVRKVLEQMRKDLAELALSTEYHVETRSHGAQCLYSTVIISISPNSDDYTSQLLAELIASSIDNALERNQRQQTLHTKISFIKDRLRMVGLIASACALRCGASVRIADNALRFLIELAIDKTGTNPFSSSGSILDLANLDLASDAQVHCSTILALEAAAIAGSILATDCGTLTKQRLSHQAIKLISDRISHQALAQSGDAMAIQAVSVASHVLCMCHLRTVAVQHVESATTIVLVGLARENVRSNSIEWPMIVKVSLAALLKVFSSHPQVFEGKWPALISAAMRSFATSVRVKADGLDLTCKVLALQILSSVAQGKQLRNGLKSLRPAVVALLGAAMNHQSRIVRLAAIEVRNAWFLLE